LLIRRRPGLTLFPYTTLFRSNAAGAGNDEVARRIETESGAAATCAEPVGAAGTVGGNRPARLRSGPRTQQSADRGRGLLRPTEGDRKSTRLNSSHDQISYAVF